MCRFRCYILFAAGFREQRGRWDHAGPSEPPRVKTLWDSRRLSMIGVWAEVDGVV